MVFHGRGQMVAIRLAGLATGSYTITPTSAEESWVTKPVKDIALTEGQGDCRA